LGINRRLLETATFVQFDVLKQEVFAVLPLEKWHPVLVRTGETAELGNVTRGYKFY
jgi:hypothetical protein